MTSRLHGKVALVTGSSSGLGEAIALLMAARGATVTFHGRDTQRLESVLEKAVAVSGGQRDRFYIVEGDITKQSVRGEIVEKTVARFGRLDILVLNAGVAEPKCQLEEVTEETYDFVMDTNVKAVFFLIQKAAPHLERSKGVIINVSSMVSTLVATPAMVYPMSKAAIDHLTHCLALNLGPKGIRVNSVNPSFIQTRIWRTFAGDVERRAREWGEAERLRTPLDVGRGATVEDVAEAVAFLASDAACFITGENMKVDGGRSLAGPYGDWPKPI